MYSLETIKKVADLKKSREMLKFMIVAGYEKIDDFKSEGVDKEEIRDMKKIVKAWKVARRSLQMDIMMVEISECKEEFLN